MSKKAKVDALVRAGLSNVAIVAKTKFSLDFVQHMRWRLHNAKRFDATRTASRRRHGVRPRAVVVAAKQAVAAKMLARIERHRQAGLSYSQTGKKLRLTKGQIAGLRHRAKKFQRVRSGTARKAPCAGSGHGLSPCGA